MTVTTGSFLTDYPEFAGAPKGKIAYWIAVNSVIILGAAPPTEPPEGAVPPGGVWTGWWPPPWQWGGTWAPYPIIAPTFVGGFAMAGLTDVAIELMTAHNVALDMAAQKAAASGGIPGLSVGVVSSKAVGAVSLSYDNTTGLVRDGGNWNLTTYGTRFLGLCQDFGSGGLQL